MEEGASSRKRKPGVLIVSFYFSLPGVLGACAEMKALAFKFVSLIFHIGSS
jgi:hypothetical protein